MCALARGTLSLEKAHLIAPIALGLIHGAVGRADQGLALATGKGNQTRNTDADRDRKRPAFEYELKSFSCSLALDNSFSA